MQTDARKTSDWYDAEYYGTPKARENTKSNYRFYVPGIMPGWVQPLADILVENTHAHYVDFCCAYGHLVKAINDRLQHRANLLQAGFRQQGFELEDERALRASLKAIGIEWSTYAYENRVSPFVYNYDVMNVRAYQFPAGGIQTVISMDALEHFTPDDTRSLLCVMDSILPPGGHMVHLIGTPDTDPAHYEDKSHLNHHPLSWYVDTINSFGHYTFEDLLTDKLRTHPRWAATDWGKRWVAFVKR